MVGILSQSHVYLSLFRRHSLAVRVVTPALAPGVPLWPATMICGLALGLHGAMPHNGLYKIGMYTTLNELSISITYSPKRAKNCWLQ